MDEPHRLPATAGWIEVICGSMFSGKTEELLRRLHRAELAGQKIRLFKPHVDTRYANEAVVSHNQRQLASIRIRKATDILEHTSGIEVVAVDEVQFLDSTIVDIANQLANDGKRVILSGLDMDFAGQPFGPMPLLLCTAEFITKLHAICVHTGTLAHYSHRRSANAEQLELGGIEAYEPLSRAAYLAAKTKQEALKTKQARSEEGPGESVEGYT